MDGRAEPVYKIRMATSDDGINWTKLNKDLIPSRIEEDEAQASPDVFYANGKYHMFFATATAPIIAGNRTVTASAMRGAWI